MEQVYWRQIDPSLVKRAEKLLQRWLGGGGTTSLLHFSGAANRRSLYWCFPIRLR